MKDITEYLRDKVSTDGNVNESKDDYETYHKLYGSAIDAIVKYAKKRGYEINNDDVASAFYDAQEKPKKGKTKSESIEISKNGKVQKKHLQVQIYAKDDGTFELTMYVN